MVPRSKSQPKQRRSGGVPLRLLLTIPFLVQLLLAVGLTGWLSWRNSQAAVHQLARQTQNEIGQRVKVVLESYLETPRLVVQLNAQEISAGHLRLDNFAEVEAHLFRQLNQFPSVSGILLGTQDGNLRALNRRDGLHLLRTDANTQPPILEEYAMNDLGQPLERRKRIAIDFRKAPWYQSAIKAGELTWSPIFQTVDRPDLSINVNLPLFDRQGRFLGVISCGTVLSVVNDFLQAIRVSPSGVVFVVERNGLLVGTSTAKAPSYLPHRNGRFVKLNRVTATQSQHSLVRGAADSLLKQYGSFAAIGEIPQFSFTTQGDRHYVQVLPCSDGRGLDWLIVVVVPERDFMGQINSANRTTALLSLIALAGALGLGLVTANWITIPIRRLSWASRAIARGHLNQALPENQPIQELAIVAQAFNQMATQLRSAFESLEAQVVERTQQLQQSSDFEMTLKQITDRVRDSLDEDQILQGTVEELALALNSRGCNAALYDLDRQISNVKYEYTTFPQRLQGREIHLDNFAGYDQLLRGEYFQCCGLQPIPGRGRVVMLACPMIDDQGVLGDLWLINQPDYAFTAQEIRLVQQVANQCAIAIRQAHLYQSAQAQVIELERLNLLKDDFLSTVSHELRTPISNMKMATQMLEISLQRQGLLISPDSNGKPPSKDASKDASSLQRYFQILKDECQRESRLINDLLDLARWENSDEPPQMSDLHLQTWLPQIVAPYEARSRDRQQFYLKLPPQLPDLHTNADLLERILSELLENACKYTPDGEILVVAANVAKQHLALSVTNSGVEIAERERKRIFDRFYRIPNNDPWKHAGTGLGLALAKRLTERLGGILQVSSHNNMTTFTVRLPL